MGIVIETDRGREPVFPAQRSAGMVICNIGAAEPHVSYPFQLMIEDLKRINQGKTSYFHNTPPLFDKSRNLALKYIF